MIYKIKLCILIFVFIPSFSPQAEPGQDSLDSGSVLEAAKDSAYYLINQLKEDGTFEYRINIDPDIKVKKKYNILRHSGTIYAMSMYYSLLPDGDFLIAVEKAGNFIKKECMGPVSGRENLLAIWSKPELTHSKNPIEAKLGGAGLGLIALLSIEKIDPGQTSIDNLRKLGNFIVFMQKEDGSFFSKYIPSLGGRQDKWHSLYYPGEAIFGLLMLYEKEPDEAWLKASLKGLRYLAKSHNESENILIDHWFLLAAEKLFSLDKEKILPKDHEDIVDHATAICRVIVDQQIEGFKDPVYNGGFSKKGNTTQTAIRLEGLQAALVFLPDDELLRNEIESSIRKGIKFLLRAQIKKGEFKGGIPRAISKLPKKYKDSRKFNKRAGEIRIDYVQHALSAMIQYLRYYQ